MDLVDSIAVKSCAISRRVKSLFPTFDWKPLINDHSKFHIVDREALSGKAKDNTQLSSHTDPCKSHLCNVHRWEPRVMFACHFVRLHGWLPQKSFPCNQSAFLAICLAKGYEILPHLSLTACEKIMAKKQQQQH